MMGAMDTRDVIELTAEQVATLLARDPDGWTHSVEITRKGTSLGRSVRVEDVQIAGRSWSFYTAHFDSGRVAQIDPNGTGDIVRGDDRLLRSGHRLLARSDDGEVWYAVGDLTAEDMP